MHARPAVLLRVCFVKNMNPSSGLNQEDRAAVFAARCSKTGICRVTMHGAADLTSPGPNLICRTSLRGLNFSGFRGPIPGVMSVALPLFLQRDAVSTSKHRLLSGGRGNGISSQEREYLVPRKLGMLGHGPAVRRRAEIQARSAPCAN